MALEAYLNVDVEQLSEEEKDDMCQNLVKDDTGKLTSANDLKIALKLFQFLLKHKVVQVASLSSELDEFAIKQGEEEARLLQEIEDLQAQLSKKHLESNGNAEDDIRQMLHDSELNSQNLLAELQAQEQEQLSNKMEMEKLESQLAALENERLQLKRELLTLHEEMQDQHKEVETHPQESQKTHQQLLESLQQKNKQLSLLLNDIESSERENISLREKLTNIKIELSEATKNIIHTTGEIVTLQVTKEEQAEKVRYLEQLCEALRHQVEDLVKEKQKRDKELEIFEQEIDVRVQEWKDIVEKKEKELAHLHEQLALQSFKGGNMKKCESEQITLLSQTLQKREHQIDELQSQLSQATSDLNDTTSLLENMRQTTEMSHIKQNLQDVHVTQRQLMTAEEQIKVLEMRLKDAEDDAEGKSEEITKMIIQLRSYETGEFGLAEALTQIKELTHQRGIRDKHIEQLVETANLLKSNFDTMQEENLTLREKLNISPEEIVKTSETVLRNQEQNVLKTQQQQIDRLEEDLISSRIDRRTLSQQVLMLSKQLQELEVQPQIPKTPSLKHTTRSQADARATARKIRSLQRDLHQLGIDRQSLIEENEALRQGLHDILDSVHFQDGKSNVHVESKVLEHLLHALDSRHISGWYHPAMRMQAKVNAMEGNNEALREQLHSMKEEESRLLGELQQAKLRIVELEGNMQDLETDKKITARTSTATQDKQSVVDTSLHLPTELPVEGWSMITKMNKHLLQVLYERDKERGQVLETFSIQKELQHQLDDLVLQLEQIVQKQSLEKEKWTKEKAQFEEHKEEMLANLVASETQVTHLRNLWDTFSTNNEVHKEIVLQDVFNIAALSAEKEKLERVASAALRRADHSKMQVELIKAEWNESKKWIIRQFGELLRSKRTYLLRLSELESVLANSVHAASLKSATEQNAEISSKYNKLLRQHEIAINKTDREMKKLVSELEVEKEMRYNVTRMLEEANQKNHELRCPCKQSADNTSFHQVRTESETFREKQQVFHAEKMCEIMKVEVQQLTERCEGLEEEVIALHNANEQFKKNISFLEKESTGLISEERDELKSQLAHAKAEVQELQACRKHLQELADISEAQVKMLEQLHERTELQLDAFRQVNYKLQAETDQASEIARLSEDLCASHVKELAALNRISSLEKQICKMHSLNEKQEKEIEELQDSINLLKLKNLEQCRKMREEIIDLRGRELNTLPLAFFHLTVTAFSKCSAECRDLWRDLQEAKATLIVHSPNTEEMRRSCQQTLELQNALQADHSDLDCQHLIESWAVKLSEIKLKEFQSSRQCVLLEADLKQTQERLKNQESLMEALEQQLLSLDMKRMQTALGKNIKKTFDQEKPIATSPAPVLVVPQFENKPLEALPSISDTKKEPVTETVELLNDNECLKEQLISLKEEVIILTNQLKAKEDELVTYKMTCFETHQCSTKNASLQQPQVLKEPSIAIQSETALKGEENVIAPNKAALKATIDSLQNIVLQKEDTIGRYQKFLRDVREEDARIIGALQEHLRNQQADLTAQEQAYMRLKISMRHLSFETKTESHSKPTLDIQLTRINELEDEVALLTKKVSTLSADLETSQHEANYWSTVALQHVDTIEELNRRFAERKSMDVDEKKPSFCLPFNDVATMSSMKKCAILASGKSGLDKEECLRGLSKLKSHHMHSQLSAQITELRNKIDKMEEIERQQKNEIQRLRDQIPIYSRRSQQSHSDTILPQRESELIKQINRLEQQLEDVRTGNENAIVQRTQQEIKKIKSAENVARWDERKKYQMQIERLKRSLQDQSDENSLLHDKIERMHATVHRLEREKIALENQIRNLRLVEQDKVLLEERLKTVVGDSASQCLLKELQEERDRLITEVKMLNAKHTLADQENKEYFTDTMQRKRADLLKSNLELECENLELKLEVEKMRSEAPCLHHKLTHLEKMLREAHEPICKETSSKTTKSSRTMVEQENEALHKVVLHLTEQLEKSNCQIKILESNSDVNKIMALQEELRNKSLLLAKVKTLLERAAIKEKQLTEQLQILKGSIPIQRK